MEIPPAMRTTNVTAGVGTIEVTGGMAAHAERQGGAG